MAHNQAPTTVVVVTDEKPGRQGVGTSAEDGEEFRKGGKNDVSNGPVKKRHCTDILCCLLFIAHVVGVIAIASVAFSKGNPNRLIAGQDFENNFCGVKDKNIDDDKADYPLLYFTLNTEELGSGFPYNEPSKWASTPEIDVTKFSTFFRAVCVKKCPCFKDVPIEKDSTNNETETETPDCPSKSKTVTSFRNYTLWGVSGQPELPALDESLCPYAEQYCVPVPSTTISIAGRYCVPELFDAGEAKDVADYLPSGLVDSWTNFVGDIIVTWPILAISGIIALIIGMLYLIFLRYCAGVIVWVALLLVFAMFAAGGAACYVYSPEMDGKAYQDMLLWTGYVVWAIGAIIFLITLCLCKQIRLGIGIVKTAAMFIYNVPTVLLLPITFFLLTIVLYAVWLTITLFIMSSVDLEESNKGKRYSWNTDTQRGFAFVFFSLLWTNAFLIGMNQMILAGAVGIWYFTAPDANGNKKPRGAVKRAAWNACFYHMGSVAFGSLILAIIQFIKYYLQYLARQAQYAEKNPSKACAACSPCGIGKLLSGVSIANMVYVKLLLCMAYLVACFERCIKFLNKNAYIQVALLGKNFCRSAWAAFCLILRNAFRIAVLAVVGRGLRYLGLLGIVAASGVVGFFITEAWKGDEISSPIFPTIVYCLMGLVIGATIMDVLAMSIDTTLQCFVADEEMSGKGQGGEFTPPPLKAHISRPQEGGGCCGGGKTVD